MLNDIIGNSKEVEELRRLIVKIGSSNSSVLILGESGTGKELVAQAVHSCSERLKGRFIPVNCGAIPKDLLESELFGHKRGAFTGAIADKKGRFEMADKGTIFLDEIGDMSLDLQVKLLRVLQERRIDPVGGLNNIPIDVRVIAATHRNIQEEIKSGNFREDLYYRLNVIPIEIPPLRQRRTDIAQLVSYFAKLHSNGRRPVRFVKSSLELLKNYSWPGNIRELSNLIDRFTALNDGENVDLTKMSLSMIPVELRGKVKKLTEERQDNEPPITNEDDVQEIIPRNSVEDAIYLAQGWQVLPNEGVHLKQKLGEIEKNYIKQALEKSQGNVSKTARLLNVQRTTLIEKINKYNLS